MVAGMGKLRKRLLKTSPCGIVEEEIFHVRCMSHVLNLAVKEYMPKVHDKILKLRNFDCYASLLS